MPPTRAVQRAVTTLALTAVLLTACKAVPSGLVSAAPAGSAVTVGAAQSPPRGGSVDPAGPAAGTPARGPEPAGVLPLPLVTQSVLDPEVSDATVSATVCTGTKKYRPPVSYTDKVKRIELSTPVGSFGEISDPRNGHVYRVPGYRGYAGLGPSDATRVELDHFLPLSDGGDGYNPANLWPEIGGTANAPLAGADGRPANSRTKDALEDYIYHQLCPGHGQPPRMTLAQAQALYEPDWYAGYQRLNRPGATG
jgi:hypothetical protein